MSSRHYQYENSESDTISSQENEDSRIVLGEITERFMVEDSGPSTSMISMFYDRSETLTSSTSQFSLGSSNVSKKAVGKQNKKYLDQNLNNYSSVPTTQSKALRY